MAAAASLRKEHNMKNITLIKPVVLRSALNDMTVSQREIAVDFLTNRKFLLPDAD